MIIINGKFLSQELTGVQRFALEISKELIKLRDDVQIIAPPADKIIQSTKNLPVIHTGKSAGWIWEQKELYKWLKKNKSPLLLNFCNSGPLFYQPCITTIHDLATILHPEWFSKIFAFAYRNMLPQLAQKSEYVLTVSQTVKQEIINNFKLHPDKIKVIYNGLPDIFSDDKKIVEKKNQILAVGSFDPRKNLSLLVKAFAEINNPEWKLVIAGRKSDLFSFNELQLPENIKSKTEIRFDLNDEDLLNLYRESRAFVNLSFYEGFGIPVLEALAKACKVLVSDIPVYRELFSGQVSFTPINLEAVKSSLSEIMSEKYVRKPMDEIFEKYSYRKGAISLDKLINSLTGI